MRVPRQLGAVRASKAVDRIDDTPGVADWRQRSAHGPQAVVDEADVIGRRWLDQPQYRARLLDVPAGFVDGFVALQIPDPLQARQRERQLLPYDTCHPTSDRRSRLQAIGHCHPRRMSMGESFDAGIAASWPFCAAAPDQVVVSASRQGAMNVRMAQGLANGASVCAPWPR